MPNDDEVERAARKVLTDALKERGAYLLDRAVKAGSRVAHTLILARQIDANTAAHLIADVWLDGWIAAMEEVDARAERS